VWIDRLRNAVNIYAPLCGSTNKSSLPLISGSHFFKESEIERTAQGALLNGIKYTVPCVTTVNGETPRLLRPQVLENEVMLFSPYLVHGGAYNFEMDRTRMSLEIRFWGE
jgi:ectoine hydroxylase-related dioxygenase (phytanoyl-CoA dioxygenase family)